MLFRRSSPQAPTGSDKKKIIRLDFRGLDEKSPYDAVGENRAPEGKNFRIYSEDNTERSVSISSRKGSGEYLDAFGEALDTSEADTTGASYKNISTATMQAVMFTASTNDRLSKVGLSLLNDAGASGVILVTVRNCDISGNPTDIIAESSILSSSVNTTSYTLAYASFVDAPALTSGSEYYITAVTQEDGSGSYKWKTTTATTLESAASVDDGLSWIRDDTYSNLYEVYTTEELETKGMARFAPENGDNTTVLAIEDSIYYSDDATGSLTELIGGFNSTATNYYFTFGDNKIFWVNGYDQLHAWNGVPLSDATNVAANGTFEVDTTGWTGAANNTVTRTTVAGEFRTGVAALKDVSSSGVVPDATHVYTFTEDHYYKLSFYVKGTLGQIIYPRAQTVSGTGVTLTGGWDLVEYTFRATSSAASSYGFLGNTINATVYVDDVSLIDIGVERITHTELPIAKYCTFHADRLFVVSVADPNKIMYSVAPLDDDGGGNQWYYGYLSTNFVYAPTPNASDPITGIHVFQGDLVVFARTNKYVLYGTDPTSFHTRQAMGKKGCVSQNALCSDENYIYFVSDDGIFRWGGSEDELMSEKIQPEFTDISDKTKVFAVCWKRTARFYYPSSSIGYNNRCLLWDTALLEWMKDTDTNVSYAVSFIDGNDDNQLAEASSLMPMVTFAEINNHNLGKPIDFEYQAKHDSLNNPASKKRIVKFFPLLEGGGNYNIDVGIDRDLRNEPRIFEFPIVTTGTLIGQFHVGDGTRLTTSSSFKPSRVRVSGYGYYWQVQVSKRAVNNPVHFIGYVLLIKERRL